MRRAQTTMNGELERSTNLVKAAVQRQQAAEERLAELERLATTMRQAEATAQLERTHALETAAEVPCCSPGLPNHSTHPPGHVGAVSEPRRGESAAPSAGRGRG
jgi:hypothetical protein